MWWTEEKKYYIARGECASGCRRSLLLIIGFKPLSIKNLKVRSYFTKNTIRNHWRSETKFYGLYQNDGKRKNRKMWGHVWLPMELAHWYLLMISLSVIKSNSMNAGVYRSALHSDSAKCIKTHWTIFHHSAGKRRFSVWRGGVSSNGWFNHLISIWLSLCWRADI